MWLNIKTMPLQTLVDKVAKSRMWSRIGWKIEDEGTSKARFVYEIVIAHLQLFFRFLQCISLIAG